MRFFAPLLVILFIFPSVSLLANAQQSSIVDNARDNSRDNAKDKLLKDMHGVYIQTANAKLLKTPNETFLLLDQQQLLDDKSKNRASLLESFRICVTGHIVPYKTIAPDSKYPYVLVVKKLCAAS